MMQSCGHSWSLYEGDGTKLKLQNAGTEVFPQVLICLLHLEPGQLCPAVLTLSCFGGVVLGLSNQQKPGNSKCSREVGFPSPAGPLPALPHFPESS